jgi:cysteine desulfurase
MGLPEQAARASLRFSFGRTSTADDVAAVAAAIGPAVQRSRRAALAGSRRR